MADTPAPKSPSPRRTTGKQRAARIPLDYYKKPDGLGRVRFALVALAPIVALGWWFGTERYEEEFRFGVTGAAYD